DLLMLARTDDPAAVLPCEPVDLSAAVREAAGSLDDRARAAGLTLTVIVPDGLMVEAEAGRVRQLVRILLDNAIAYTPAGGSVTITAAAEKHGGRVTVRDTGIGIAPDDQSRVFDRFYRTDSSRTRASGGSGLGLAIARALVEAYRGTVGLESQPGVGTSVWFTLPQA
ncbi:MAG: sensor histidine kinase, partial [Thermomicrobiales bacterium]